MALAADLNRSLSELAMIITVQDCISSLGTASLASESLRPWPYSSSVMLASPALGPQSGSLRLALRAAATLRSPSTGCGQASESLGRHAAGGRLARGGGGHRHCMGPAPSITALARVATDTRQHTAAVRAVRPRDLELLCAERRGICTYCICGGKQ